ncbi:uncharacterized protein [Diabrotica undecimpunctata]|uniref:uncharacterized protein isoform X2 n=1 Tax=Diabrotica undecimpunctata TaxID=50387 RepID=UPI003B638AE8
MIGFLVLVSLLPVLSLCSSCKYSSDSVYCQKISQDDFLIELFRNKESISYLSEILIENSDFSNIQPFVDFSNDLNPAQVDIRSLIIRRSKVDSVGSDTFWVFRNLNNLNLSQNNITNLDWLPGLLISYYQYLNLDLSYNKIFELDFNDLGNKISSFWLNNNEISILKPATNYISLGFIDLSHNKLVSFSEFEYKLNIRSLDLSYNYLQMLALKSNKDLLKIEGHGNSNISYIGTSNSYSVFSFYSSFIPNNSLSIPNIFKLNWIDTDLPVLDSNKIPIIRSGIIDFSNNKLTSIPQNYFQSVYASVFNLSFNNFDVLSNKVFGVNSAITTIDLSFSNLKKINNEFFINCCSSNSYYYFVYVNLSHNALEELDGICTRIPQLKQLDLSSNRITNLSQISLLNCLYLSSYNISNNSINAIPPETFQGKVPIETLDISQNNLLLINESTFRNLKTVLRHIFLRKNSISSVGSKSFGDFDYLETIDLSGNKIRNIEQYAFSNLEKIDIINLSNNAIELLESYSFHKISVHNIDLQDNPIHYIKEKAFSNLNSLESLNLSNSAIAILENDVFFNLPNIRIIDLSTNYIFLLSNYTFRNLPVEHIYLHGNKIENISQNAFHNLQNLRYLDLSNLGISKIDPYAFNNMNSLVEVNLKNNNISNPIILDNTIKINKLIIQLTGTVGERFISSIFLQNLTIIDSHIELLKNNCFVNLPLLTSLNLINTTIDFSEDNIFNGLTRLTYLDASQIFQYKTSLKEYTFKDMRNLEVLNISNSAVDTIEINAFVGLSKLTELQLKGNKLTVVNLTAITNGLPNLIKLNLSSSSIKNVQTSKLGNPNKVKYLDLSNNFIENLDSQTFRLFENLVELLLHNNELSTIEYQTFYYSKNLKTLRLDNNKITALRVGVMAGLENLSFLNISDNVNLFFHTNNLLPLETLKTLRTLYLDNTSLQKHMFDFTTFRKSFRSLSKIGINNNQFTCIDLLNLLTYLEDNNIDYTPYNPKFEIKNLHGLTCI